jgi:hypothetical protein
MRWLHRFRDCFSASRNMKVTAACLERALVLNSTMAIAIVVHEDMSLKIYSSDNSH